MPPIDTFWTTNGTGGTNLIEATPGDAYTDPYKLLPGSTGVDFTNPQVWVDARLLFRDAMLDPGTGLYPDRPDFTAPSGQTYVSMTDFSGWHSQHQAEYVLELGETGYSPAPAVPGDPPPVGAKAVHYVQFDNGPTVVLGQDGRTTYTIEALKLSDFATMPLADQEALAELDIFQEQAIALLVRPAPGETVQDVRDDMLALVKEKIDKITLTTNYSPSDRDKFLKSFLFDQTARVRYYPHFFIEELNLYKLRLENMALFSEARIQNFLDELEDRFDRIKMYHDVSPETSRGTGLAGGVNAFDGNLDKPTMGSGLGIFIEMEHQLFQIALSRAYVASTGTVVEPVRGRLISTQAIIDAAVYYDLTDLQQENKKFKTFETLISEQSTDIYDRLTSGESQQRLLDGPNLIFVLQTFDNYESEAEAQIKSEELQQQSAILKDYSRMQELLNLTLGKFEAVPDVDNKDTPAETHGLLDLALVSELSADQKRVAAMFDTAASSITTNTYHPIEFEKSSGSPKTFRPTVEIASAGTLLKHEKTIWDALAVQLGESTKIIGQSSQIQMDAINKLSQEKNRHYELGSNVLNKMTEILRSITSLD